KGGSRRKSTGMEALPLIFDGRSDKNLKFDRQRPPEKFKIGVSGLALSRVHKAYQIGLLRIVSWYILLLN
ncbi:MAG: hypothetical protein K9J79_11935, partial [Desulfobacteraceae bacterium]|nr:hypothetical protein [Desulfobacteraceae bacterium]